MALSDDKPHAIHRRPAQSGKVSYGDAVVLHETSRSRVTLVPFFIQHTDHTELSVKITTYKKKPPPEEWAVVQEKALSLNEQATRRLLSALQDHLQVAREDEDGRFLLLRLDEAPTQIAGHDPAAVAGALTKALSQDAVVEHLKDAKLSTELTAAFRSAIRLREMRSAVAQLREYLNNGEADEKVYQKWCKQHTWAFGNAYVLPDDVRNISTGDQLDLLLPSVIAGYRDIVELKRPDKTVLQYDSTHKNYYFSADVSKAVGQCHRYLDVLHEEAGKGLRDNTDIVAYHPRAVIVIGRSAGWQDEQHKAMHGLNRRLSSIRVMTYDHLLAQGERLLEMLDDSAIDEIFADPTEWDDDILF